MHEDPDRCYLGVVTKPDSQDGADGDAMLRAAGIAVTDDGKARWRRRLRAADARWTPERHAALRRQVGLPEKTA